MAAIVSRPQCGKAWPLNANPSGTEAGMFVK